MLWEVFMSWSHKIVSHMFSSVKNFVKNVDLDENVRDLNVEDCDAWILPYRMWGMCLR